LGGGEEGAEVGAELLGVGHRLDIDREGAPRGFDEAGVCGLGMQVEHGTQVGGDVACDCVLAKKAFCAEQLPVGCVDTQIEHVGCSAREGVAKRSPDGGKGLGNGGEIHRRRALSGAHAARKEAHGGGKIRRKEEKKRRREAYAPDGQ